MVNEIDVIDFTERNKENATQVAADIAKEADVRQTDSDMSLELEKKDKLNEENIEQIVRRLEFNLTNFNM